MKKKFFKLLKLLKRRKSAKKLAIAFERASGWEMPSRIVINRELVKLNLVNDGSTQTAFIDIFLDDCYGLLFFKAHLKNIKTVVDIGANQGLFTLAARSFYTEATIHAYEPNPEILPYLNFQCSAAKATFFNEAVGLNDGFIQLQFEKDSLHTKTINDDNGAIMQTSFRNCLKRIGGTLDLLKLDCEGAEWEILQDYESLKNVKAITLEYHLNALESHDKVLKVLQKTNYTCVHHSIDGKTWGVVWATKNSDLN